MISAGYKSAYQQGYSDAKRDFRKEPKTAHWVNGEYCSNCGCDIPAYIIDWKWQKDMDAKYCPNCGRRMIKPQAKSEENKI